MADTDKDILQDNQEIEQFLEEYLLDIEDLIDKHYLVYAHILPNKTAYIGMTGNSVQVRSGSDGSMYKEHQPQLYNDAIALGGWDKIKHYTLMQGLTHEEAIQYEEIFSYMFEQAGYTLYNKRYGFMGYHHTEEAKLKISQAFSGRVHTEKTKRKISEVLKGKVRTEEQKEANRQRMLAYYTEERRKAHSELCAEANRNRQCGKPLSQQTKERISAALKGRDMSLEWRNKISNALKGHIPVNRRKVVATYKDDSQIVFDSLADCDAYFKKYRGWTYHYCGKDKFTSEGVKLDYIQGVDL